MATTESAPGLYTLSLSLRFLSSQLVFLCSASQRASELLAAAYFSLRSLFVFAPYCFCLDARWRKKGGFCIKGGRFVVVMLSKHAEVCASSLSHSSSYFSPFPYSDIVLSLSLSLLPLLPPVIFLFLCTQTVSARLPDDDCLPAQKGAEHQSLPLATVTHVNLHTPPRPCSLHKSKKESDRGEEGGIQREKA